jgi:hypothetical protein
MTRRLLNRLLTPYLLSAALLVSGLAHAEEPDDEAPVIAPETVGTWRFRDDQRPIKAMALGGSVTAWPKGSYSQFLHLACSNVEIVNQGKARIGARQLKQRFVKQLLKNRRIKITDHRQVWLLFQGGLNSLGQPERTNRDVSEIFLEAHQAGVKVVALSLMSWGSPGRWRDAKGLHKHANTRLAVDFVLGKLTPAQALGRWALSRKSDQWQPGELPDIAVDLYDSDLRHRAAPLLDEARLRPRVAADPWVKSQLRELPEAERAAALDRYVKLATELPRWFMREELQAFDPIHPNMEGHRIMAQAVCPKLPADWGCDCGAIATMKWSVKGGGLVR